jgi:hypothetical protein
VLGRGVAGNLNRAEPDDARANEFARVSEHARKVGDGLEQKLQDNPGPAQAGLQRALEASKPGRDRALEAGKGTPR